MAAVRPVVLGVGLAPAARAALAPLCSDAGLAVVEVGDAAGALERSDEASVAVVALAAGRARQAGLALCRRLRDRERPVYLPIIVVGPARAASRRAAFAAGADDYVPLRHAGEELGERVRVWLRQHVRLQAAASVRADGDALRALHEVCRALGGVHEPDALAKLVVERARRLVGVDAAALFWWSERTGLLRALAHATPRGARGGPLLRPGEGAAGQAFVRREPVVVEDYPRWPRAVAIASERPAATVAAVPLLVGDRAVGALVVWTYGPHQYSDEALQLLRLLGAQLGPVFEATLLYVETERQRQEAAALADLARRGAADPEPERVLTLVTEHACRLLGADYGAVALREPDGGYSWHGVHGARAAVWRPVPSPGEGGCGPAYEALTTGRTVVYGPGQPRGTAELRASPGHRREGGRVALATPLISRDETLGALMLGWRRDVEVLPQQAQLAEALASYAATVLDDARARAEVRAQAEALRRLAAERTAVIEQMPSGLVVVDAEGRVVFLNAAARHVWRSDPHDPRPMRERVREMPFLDGATGQPISPDATPAQRVLRGETVQDYEYYYPAADGREVWIRFSGVPLRDGEGRVTGAVLILSNVTRERTLLRELKASEERFRTLYESVASGVIVRDPTGRIVEANQVAARLLATPVEAMRGQYPRELWPTLEATGPAPSATGLTVVQTRQPLRGVTRHIRLPDGEERWIQIDHVPVLGANGEVVQIVDTFVDVTERKRTEQRIQAMAQTEKWRALGQMASGVAHDLNQYLGLVAGHGDLALHALDQAHPDLDAVRDSLRVVVQAAMDGADSVKRLLAFARPRQEGPAQRVDLGELLQEVAKLTAPRWRDAAQAQGRPIGLTVTTEGDTVIMGWPESLREALTNLVFNAVDALPHGGTIDLAARRVGQRVEVIVADSGIGMSAEVRAHLFEPFYSTKGAHGTGLGLAMVYGIVERHGGQIAVDSAPGQGTTFRLTFPAAPADAEDEAARPARRPATAPRRILAVDDEPALARMIALMLAPEGHSVVTATSAEEALERLAAERFDLVVSDLGLGAGMNGWDLAAEVQTRYPGMAFVLATGWGAQIDLEEARGRGVHAVLAKPYRVAEVRELIAELAARGPEAASRSRG